MARNIYQEALDVQNAVNLSGVVKSWAEITSLIWDEAHRLGHGTDWVNHHPVNVLFADKCRDLTDRSQIYAHDYGEAYEECERKAKELEALTHD